MIIFRCYVQGLCLCLLAPVFLAGCATDLSSGISEEYADVVTDWNFNNTFVEDSAIDVNNRKAAKKRLGRINDKKEICPTCSRTVMHEQTEQGKSPKEKTWPETSVEVGWPGGLKKPELGCYPETIENGFSSNLINKPCQ